MKDYIETPSNGAIYISVKTQQTQKFANLRNAYCSVYLC